MNNILIFSIVLITTPSVMPMEYSIVSIVGKDTCDSTAQKILRFSAFVKCPHSKHLCYAYSEKTIPVPSSVLCAHLCFQARIYSHVHGWKNLNLYETETLFAKLSAQYYAEAVQAENHQELEITNSSL